MTIRRAIAALIALASMAGCVSTMVSTREDLQSLSESEGVVFGSILVTVEKQPERESLAGGLFAGLMAEKMDWSVHIWETGMNPLKTSYSVVAKPGKEEIFIKKLPVGTYRIDRIEHLFGGSNPYDGLDFSVAAHFSVKPRQVSYIGKIVVDFPNRVRVGSPVQIRILDAQDETIEKLRAVHPSTVGKSMKDLATRGE
jgi:hypothetical protein